MDLSHSGRLMARSRRTPAVLCWQMLFRAFQPTNYRANQKKVTSSDLGICSAPSPGHKIFSKHSLPLGSLASPSGVCGPGRKNRSPLRYASVGMTKGTVGFSLRICGLGKETAGPSTSLRTGWHYSRPAYLASSVKLSFNSTDFCAASGSTTRYIFASACLPSNVITT